MATPQTSFRLSEEARSLIRAVADRQGITDANVVEAAVRLYASWLDRNGYPRPGTPSGASGRRKRPTDH